MKLRSLRNLSSWTLLIVLTCAASASAHPYGWTISASSTDPFVNEGPPQTPFVQTLYLHYACNESSGLTGTEFGLRVVGDLQVLAFTPKNGFLNAGGATNLFLAVGGCPIAPAVAGEFLVLNQGEGEVCFGPSSIRGINGTWNCDTEDVALFDHDVVGYSTLGAPPSCSMNLCGPQEPCDQRVATQSEQLRVYRECTVDVPVRVTGACDLGGFQYDVEFDAERVRFEEAIVGDFLGSTGRNVIEFSPVVTEGRVTHGAASLGESMTGPDGAGHLGTIRLLNINQGDAVRVQNFILDVELADTFGNLDVATSTLGVANLGGYIFADFNQDCEVRIGDIMSVAARWGSTRGEPRYDVRYDIDLLEPGSLCISVPDEDIDIVDVQLAASRFGATCLSSTTGAAAVSVPDIAFSLEPATIEGAVGEIVELRLVAEGAQDLAAFEFVVESPHGALEIVEVADGGWLGSSGNEVTIVDRFEDTERSATSRHRVGGFSVGTGSGVQGSGVLAILRVRLGECGTSSADIREALGVTLTGQEIPVARATGASIQCGGVAGAQRGAALDVVIEPNPFVGRARVSFDLGREQRVRVDVYDLSGRRVTRLAEAHMSAGKQVVDWNGRDAEGELVAAGVYFVRVAGEQKTQTRKLTVTR